MAPAPQHLTEISYLCPGEVGLVPRLLLVLVERRGGLAEGDAELAGAKRVALVVADQVEEALKVDLVNHVVALHPRLHLPHPVTPGQLALLLLLFNVS